MGNNKREINITLSGGDGSITWKNSIFTLLSGVSNENFIKSNISLKDPVNTNVWLPMTSVPGIDGKIGLSHPVESILGSVVDGAAAGVDIATGSVGGKAMDLGKKYGGALIQTAYQKQTGKTLAPWWFNLPAFQTDKQPAPKFSLSFTFSMGQFGLWNALEEVVKPILNLSAPIMLRDLTNVDYKSPFPTPGELLDAKTIFESLMSMANKNEDTTLFKLYENYTHTIQFGNFVVFNNMVLTSAKSSFGTNVDQFGYPVTGTVTLDYEGMVPMAIKSTAGSGASNLVTMRFGV